MRYLTSVGRFWKFSCGDDLRVTGGISVESGDEAEQPLDPFTKTVPLFEVDLGAAITAVVWKDGELVRTSIVMCRYDKIKSRRCSERR